MAESRAPTDPYTLEFEAIVDRILEVDDCPGLVLNETYFYPEGGGQPADRGTVAGLPVADVHAQEGSVIHVLGREAKGSLPEVGATVTGAVDPSFRRYCMRAHTASHALYGAGRQLLDDLGYGGFNISEKKVRVDFSTPTHIDDATLVELEQLTNRAVWDSRSVTWETYPKDEALAMDDIAFNTKTAEGIAGDTVRVVTINGRDDAGRSPTDPKAEPWDVAACGGTHVRNTREIGPVTVRSRSNPGEGLTRVEFAVGPAGIRRRAIEKGAALDAADALGTNVNALPDEVKRLREERDALADEVDTLEGRLVDARISELREECVERDGRTWLVGAVEGLDANALAERAGDLAGEAAGVVALVSPEGTLAVGSSGEVDASTVVASVTDEFGGGGGGSTTVAQGGGLEAEAKTVVAFLRGE